MIKERGLRATPARRKIMTLLHAKENHLSTNEILVKLNKSRNPTSAATLYQNLAKLTEAGLISRFLTANGTIKYDSNLSVHHHLVCNKCGKILDVSIGKNAESRVKPSDFSTGKPVKGWKVHGFQYVLKGICPECLK